MGLLVLASLACHICTAQAHYNADALGSESSGPSSTSLGVRQPSKDTRHLAHRLLRSSEPDAGLSSPGELDTGSSTHQQPGHHHPQEPHRHQHHYPHHHADASYEPRRQHHPAVYSLRELGIWQASFLGQVHNSTTGRWQPLQLQQWHRLRCEGATMHLRGIGSAFQPQESLSDTVHSLIPWSLRLPAQLPALTLTDAATGTPAALQESIRDDGSHTNAWHIEAAGLSVGSRYLLQSELSLHSYEVDATRCSSAPAVFRSDAVWSVVTQAAYMDLAKYAVLVAEHTSYHQLLGFRGTILLVSSATADGLLAQQALQPALTTGSLVFITWDHDTVPSMPYYYQPLWYNLVILTTWGSGVKLAVVDLDEYIVLPSHMSITEALAVRGCMHGYDQARVRRHNVIFWSSSNSSETGGSSSARSSSNTDSTGGGNSSRSSSDGCLAGAPTSNCSSSYSSTPAAEPPDLLSLMQLGGWRKFLAQGYRVEYYGAGGMRFSHKSIISPDTVSWYAVHEGQVVPGGRDSNHSLPESCAFGLHFINMYRHRTGGTGREFLLPGGKRFDAGDYSARLEQLLQKQQRRQA